MAPLRRLLVSASGEVGHRNDRHASVLGLPAGRRVFDRLVPLSGTLWVLSLRVSSVSWRYSGNAPETNETLHLESGVRYRPSYYIW